MTPDPSPSQPARRYRKRGSITLGPSVVWRRHEFRESSRLITLLTRELGLIRTLAKGAHRPTSPFLGRVDYLNSVEPRIARHGDALGLRLLHGVELVHEPRALRAPRRYLAAAHLTDFATAAFPVGRSDPPVFDLVQGGLRLLERCPIESVTKIVLALEVRFLDALGELPAIPTGGPGRRPVETAVAMRSLDADSRSWLHAATELPGRAWDRLPKPPTEALVAIGDWLRHSTERALPLRGAALQGSAPLGSAPLESAPQRPPARHPQYGTRGCAPGVSPRHDSC